MQSLTPNDPATHSAAASELNKRDAKAESKSALKELKYVSTSAVGGVFVDHRVPNV